MMHWRRISGAHLCTVVQLRLTLKHGHDFQGVHWHIRVR
jgi:hypothetical protein